MRIGSNGVIAFGTVCLIIVMITAVAHQSFSWWVIPFVVLFGTIFISVLGLSYLNYRNAQFRRKAMSEYPDQPWLWDERWQSDLLLSRSKSEFWGTLAFAIILSMFAISGVVSLVQGLSEGNLWVLLNIIPIVAAVYFGRNTYVAWQTMRLERSATVITETHPARVGDQFSALLELQAPDQPEQSDAWLEHYKIIRREDSDGTTFEKVVDRKLPCTVEKLAQGKARISIDLPANSPPTKKEDNAPHQWWDLVISTRISNTNVLLRYEIPVFAPTADEELTK